MKTFSTLVLYAIMGFDVPLIAQTSGSGSGAPSATHLVIDVRAYGAEGNGTADDGPAIQRAIDSAYARGGGNVYLPQSEYFYKTTSPLRLRAGVALYGDGNGSRIYRTASHGAVIDVDGQSDFSIHDLRLSGAGMLDRQSTFGINIHNGSHDGSVTACTIDEHYLGIAVQGVREADVSHITISRNTVSHIGLNPVGVNTRGSDITVTENTFDTFGSAGTMDNIAAGVEMRGVAGGMISSNAIRNGSSHFGMPIIDGIRIEYLAETPDQNPSGIECSNNTIDSIGGYGIRAIYARHCIIARNTLTGLGTGGIYLVSSDSPRKTCDSNAVTNNRIDCAHDGIYLESTHGGETNHRHQCTHNEISGNTVRHSRQYGLHIWGGSHNTITSNQFIESGDIGIYQHGGSNNTYTNNAITDASMGSHAPLPACYVAGDTNNVFVNCTIVRSDSASNQISDIKIGMHAVGTVVRKDAPGSPPLNYRPSSTVSVSVLRSLNLIGIKVSPNN